MVFAFTYIADTKRCGDSVDNTVEENSSIFSVIQMHWLPSARACTGSYWRCRLMQVDLNYGRKMVVVVVYSC